MSAINAIYNANVYLDGVNLLGRAAEFKMPEIEISQDEHKGLGMVGTIKLPSGVEALEGEITWNSVYPEVAAKAFNPFKAAQLMVRGNLQTFNAQGLAQEVPVVITVAALFSKNALGTFKPKEKKRAQHHVSGARSPRRGRRPRNAVLQRLYQHLPRQRHGRAGAVPPKRRRITQAADKPTAPDSR